jgi:cytoskeletal protein CcmA (bactofilin family)
MAMFGGDEKMESAQAETTVGVDVTIKGNLKSPSSIMVNGTVKGKVETKTEVNVGEKATIEGSVAAKKITISGVVKGNVEGRESIEITASGKIFGDISTSNLVILSGAIFVGKSMMFEKGEGAPEEETTPLAEETEEEAPMEGEESEQEAEGVLQ